MNKFEIIIFDKEVITKTLIESYLKEIAFPFELKKYSEFDETIIRNSQNKKIIIVDINRANYLILKKIALLSKNRNNNFLIISNEKSTNLSVQALRAGAKDFLLKPLAKSNVLTAMKKIHQNSIVKQNKKNEPKVFTASSVDFSVGKTVFLINLAKELADKSGEKVLLIDFNNSLNDISFLLNIDISSNSTSFINSLKEEGDFDRLNNINKYGNSSLYIMANGFAGHHSAKVDVQNLDNALSILKKKFKYILIDKDSSVIDLDKEVIRLSDIIFFIIPQSITSFDKVNLAINHNYASKTIKVILNKFEQKNPKKVEQISKELEKGIFWKIPKNYMAMGSAANNYKTLNEVAPNLDISKAYAELAKYLIDRE